MLPSVRDHAGETILQLFAFILAQGNTDYLGERVSQLEHSLQCAHLAHQSEAHGTDPEVVLGALLHDVGRFIPDTADMPKMIAPDGAFIGRASHEVLGERYLRQLGFGEKVGQLVGAHVMAKRYLTAVETEYYDGLSETSKRTLRYQGGVFTPEQVDEARKDPWLEAKLAVRRWDDQAKVPGVEVPELQAYKQLAVEYLTTARSRICVDSRRYKIPEKPMLIVSVPGESLKDVLGSNNSMKESRAWTMRCFSREVSSQQVFDQLVHRGVRVAALSSSHKGLDFVNAEGLLNFSAEDSQMNGQSLHAWLGIQPPCPDAIGRVRFATQTGVKLLDDDRADIVFLSITDSLPCDSLTAELVQIQGLGAKSTTVVTAFDPDDSSGTTMLDVAFT
ncbi:hypothetical protein BDV59DRAFT_197942 [Aspergillus ambiguus]|uniref:uncharacterized protein n=1 Tax=Aspergillus ambiguus TaxID=176160 RepID=UPI003CCE4864